MSHDPIVDHIGRPTFHLTRLGLVALAERAGFAVEDFGGGEHRQITEYANDGTPKRRVILWNDGRIVSGGGDAIRTANEAARYLGLTVPHAE